ncbi:flippase [Thermococcus sp. MV11]|uniref:flippase n=1 Tax=Thermococcus sp. MV11 TaxID=1638267 RepID=UPI001431CFBE|nr:flippase [Thermococcus sp. MV11]NJE03845.1 flippase [Thermococcus sp. MV11]
MSEASQALQKIARGTGIVFAGTVISMLLGFLSRAVIARYFSTGEYGVFNLALTVLNVVLVIVMLGFSNSLPREVAFYREKEPQKVADLTSTALIIVALNSLFWVGVLLLGADELAGLFNDDRLVSALRVVVFALPFWALTGVIIAISRGFGRVREMVYIQNVLYPLIWLTIVLSLVLLRLPFTAVFWGYVMAQFLTFAVLLLETRRIGLITFSLSVRREVAKELVLFSVPLMLVGILNFLMTWTDTLMLGHYKGSEVVGLYNAASPLARLIPVFLGSAGILYAPIVTPLYAWGKIGEMGRVYRILTKWIFFLTLPLFALLFLFPEVAISFFFGQKYLAAAQALRILSAGFMFHTLLGLNGLSLLVIGQPKLNMIGDTFAVVSNVVLNLLLIPEYGMTGAAVATAVSYFVANVFRSFWLYQRTGIHPFGWSYVKPLVIGFFLLGLVMVSPLQVSNIWWAILVLAAFFGVYIPLVLLSGSVDKEDVELILAIEKKLGVDLGIIKKVLKRFV